MDAVVSAADPVTLLRAVADQSRLRILRLLDLEELNGGELARCTGLGQSSVSRHVRSLREAGLVEERSEGVSTYLRLAGEDGERAAVVEAVVGMVRDPEFGHEHDLARLERIRAERDGDREQFFDSLAEDWDVLREELLGGGLAPPELLSLLVPEGLRIVDAGTGTGVLLPWLAAVAGPTGEIVAVESSPAMAKRARERAKALSSRAASGGASATITVRRGRIESLPVDDAWADVVVLSLALGHTRDPAAALARCAAATRPGGRVVVADVERHGDRTLVERLGAGFSGFDEGELLDALRASGLTAVRRVRFPAAPHGVTTGCRTPDATRRARGIPLLSPLFAVGVVPHGDGPAA